MVRRYQGKTKFMWMPVTASTALLADALVKWTSGQLVAAPAACEGYDIAGVLRHAIASTDSDYASERNVEVEVPTELNVVWEVTVDATAALLVTDIGTYMDIGSDNTGDDIESGTSTYDTWLCVGFISATKGLFIGNWGVFGRRKAAS